MKQTEEIKWDTIKRFFDNVFENPNAFPDNTVIFTWDEKELSRLFTKERLRLIKTIREKKPKTIKKLAEKLDRKLSAVSRDLSILEGLGVIKLEKKGRKVKPIIIKSILIFPLISIKPKTIEQYEAQKIRL